MRLLSFAFSTLILCTPACRENSETGRKQLNLVDDAEMNEMGAQAFQDISSQSRISDNSQLVRQVVSIGQQIASTTGESYDWEIALFESGERNAFCLPGGKIGVFTGIITLAENNAGLAAVLGHEVAHAVLRHSAERMSQQLLLQTGLALSSVTFGQSPYKNLIAAALGVGSVYGVSLPFSRLHEREADRLGLEYMSRAGFDPREAIRLWERMGEADQERPPEILSTHPDPSSRAKDLQKELDSALALYNASNKIPTVPLYRP